MDNQYDLFARFYRELIISSGHLANEQKTILKIISKLNIGYSSDILDAACGTGDALYFLHNNGYKKLTGLDFSKKMLDKAKNILPFIAYYNASWNSISTIKELANRFDLIMIISVSILHADSIKELEMVLCSLRDSLKKDGKLVIDNRMWVENGYGLIESGREIGRYNHICTSEIDGEIYIMEDICTYNDDKQMIEYKIESSTHRYTVRVTYLRIMTSLLIEILYKIGFSKVLTESCNTWPYELIYAYK